MSRDELSALEAAFLYAESPMTPMHIGSLSIFDAEGWRLPDGTLRVAALRRHIEARLPAVPRLVQHPIWPLGPLGRPYWAADPDFDISRHVRRLTLRVPGGDEQLMAAVADLHMHLLDRHHPLWEMWFVDGLSGGRVALVEKIHHALVDGIGGVDVAMLQLDTEPHPAPAGAGPTSPDGAVGAKSGSPGAVGLLARALLDMVEEPVAAARAATRRMAHPAGAILESRRLVGAAADLLGDLRAPHTSLNDPIGPRRVYRVVRQPLERIRRSAHALGGSVNDAVLAAVASAVYDLLEHRGEDLQGARLHALVPVSVRSDDEHEALGNRVSAMVIPLEATQPDAAARFAAAHAAVRSARAHHQVELTTALLRMAEFLPEPLLASASGLIHHQFLVNLVITNVPGPPVPLYLMGARMLEACPIVPLGGNLGVSVGILSYEGQLTFGLWADAEHVPDLDRFAKGIEHGFAALDMAVAAGHTGA
ncbi:MAG TPA: wax ester/triacylglycerol synthase family O-acyltransferase [Acidimicrobiales bacterium]|nr:wax ester/triacylglycerol synthase family O-acyltransferase [Acidimicrobiales bacterium]